MKLLNAFIAFFKIGAFTLGGGYAMLPLIQAEVVDKKKWLSNEEFIDTIAIAQSSPGPVAVNSSIFIGYKLSGVIGSIVCTLGVVLPSFISILLIVKFLYQYRNNEIIDQVFSGIRPAVVALIFSSVYKLAKTSKLNKYTLLISLLSLMVIVLFNVSPIIVILSGGLGAVVYFKVKERKEC
ncbi:chromate transporter [Brassicibacter mesophilus]|uniref:chromate transporter n=1 Tax=Brassicibacter mesophilus TaxID=745119 RepID=UPI003D1F5B72